MFLESLIVALVGMVVVFAALVIIIFGIKLYTHFVRDDKPKKKNPGKGQTVKESKAVSTASGSSLNNSVQASEAMSPELIAVITAAVMSAMQGSLTGTVPRVKSIKRVGQTSPLWNAAGKNEYILSKL